MKISERVILRSNYNKVGTIISIDPMVQVRFNDGDTCWHKESELTTTRETPIGTWVQCGGNSFYYGVVTNINRDKNTHTVVWFTFAGGQLSLYRTQELTQFDMDTTIICPCPTLTGVSK